LLSLPVLLFAVPTSAVGVAVTAAGKAVTGSDGSVITGKQYSKQEIFVE
jgi:hypothetical protein